MEFPYYSESSFLDAIEINNIGDCAIEANNDDGMFWYLIIRTSLGWTQIIQYGPICPDIKLFPDKVNCSFERFEYNNKKVGKIIRDFLNSFKKPYSKITQAKLIDTDTALNSCRSIIDYAKNFDEKEQY